MLFHLHFENRVSPFSSRWLAIYYVDQASLESVAIFCLLSAGILLVLLCSDFIEVCMGFPYLIGKDSVI